jgi:hypothetical protein
MDVVWCYNTMGRLLLSEPARSGCARAAVRVRRFYTCLSEAAWALRTRRLMASTERIE